MSSDNTPIPNKALRRFERVEGIPLPVINELFFRMQMPENLQQAFWEQVAAKEWKEFTGRAQAITIFKDGMTMVTVEDRHGNTTLFVTVQGLCSALVGFSVTGRVDLQVWQ